MILLPERRLVVPSRFRRRQGGFVLMPQMVGRRGAPRLEYIGTTTSDADGGPYTFSSASIGPAHATRIVVVAVATVRETESPLSTSVTLGGASMDERVSVSDSTFRYSFAGIYTKALATGTTADIVVTQSGVLVLRCGISVFSLTYADSATPTDTDSQINGSDLTLDIPGRGVALAVGSRRSNNLFTWTGATEAHDTAYDTSRFSSATKTISPALSGHTISAPVAHALVGAAWA